MDHVLLLIQIKIKEQILSIYAVTNHTTHANTSAKFTKFVRCLIDDMLLVVPPIKTSFSFLALTILDSISLTTATFSLKCGWLTHKGSQPHLKRAKIFVPFSSYSGLNK